MQILGGEKYKLEGTNHKRKTCANMCHVLSLLVHVRGIVLFSVKNGTEYYTLLGLYVYAFSSSTYQEFHIMFSISYQSICNFIFFVFRDEGNEQMILYEIGLVSNQYVRGNQ